MKIWLVEVSVDKRIGSNVSQQCNQKEIGSIWKYQTLEYLFLCLFFSYTIQKVKK